MKKFAWLFSVIICMAIPSHAQTFLDHLKRNSAGKGAVTITQSKEIDELVNGSKQTKPQVTNEQKKEVVKPTATTNKTEPTKKETKTNQRVVTGDSAKQTESKKEPAIKPVERREKITHQRTESNNQQQEEDEITIPTVDMRRKVMRGSRKVTGYRVQAFSGGNSRIDRQKAEQACAAIKMKYPDQPIYVHFYSPRWICRVGNYRSFEEASEMLRKVKALGYHQACIVKGKITVQY